MKQSVALAEMALPATGVPTQRVATVNGRAVERAEWVRRVQAWCRAFQRVSGEEVGFYFEDSLEFSAALWGAWHAGKTPVLLSDLQPATLNQLLPTVGATAGLLPNAVCADVSQTSDNVLQPLQPLDMQARRLVLFTSGSTGKPERIVKKVAQLDAEMHALQSAFGGALDASPPQILATVSHQHIYGLLFRILWPLSAGREIGTRFARYPEELLEQLGEHDNAVLISSPAMLGRLPEQLAWGRVRAHVKVVFSSGGPLSAQASELCHSLLGQSPTEVFGSSETGGIAWRRRAEQGDVWQTLPGVDVRLDADGLLSVRSSHLPDPDVWWDTADRAQPLQDGSSFVLQGRVDRIVKIAEKRVSLTALEQSLQASEWVQSARAVLIEKPGLPERVGMVLELTEAGWQELLAKGRKAMGVALRDWLAPSVERVALPRQWRYVTQLPMNEQGKITQQNLLALFDPVMPQPEWIQRSDTEACVRLQIIPQLRVLDGHFPAASLIPGVAQLHWAVNFARQAFDVAAIYSRAELVKFQQPILPGDCVDLQLKLVAETEALHFTFTSDRGTHASGRLLKAH